MKITRRNLLKAFVAAFAAPLAFLSSSPQAKVAAISIPFSTLPMNLYIRGPRYLVMFDRIVTPRFSKDVGELKTWGMDIRSTKDRFERT